MVGKAGKRMRYLICNHVVSVVHFGTRIQMLKDQCKAHGILDTSLTPLRVRMMTSCIKRRFAFCG